MVDKVFNNWSSLEKYLTKQINEVLDDEVAKCVKDNMVTAIDEVVYEPYEPVSYKRRGARKDDQSLMGNPLGTGSIADINEMDDEIIQDGVLKVTNNAERNPDYKYAGIGYDTSKSLAENIVEGYGSKLLPYNKRRDFISKTVEILNNNKAHIDVMKEELEKRLGEGTVI